MKNINGEILAVVPEYCSGPGWTNSPVWVYWRDIDQTIQQTCIQPEKQTAELIALSPIGSVVQTSLIKAVKRMRK